MSVTITATLTDGREIAIQNLSDLDAAGVWLDVVTATNVTGATMLTADGIILNQHEGN